MEVEQFVRLAEIIPERNLVRFKQRYSDKTTVLCKKIERLLSKSKAIINLA